MAYPEHVRASNKTAKMPRIYKISRVTLSTWRPWHPGGSFGHRDREQVRSVLFCFFGLVLFLVLTTCPFVTRFCAGLNRPMVGLEGVDQGLRCFVRPGVDVVGQIVIDRVYTVPIAAFEIIEIRRRA